MFFLHLALVIFPMIFFPSVDYLVISIVFSSTAQVQVPCGMEA